MLAYDNMFINCGDLNLNFCNINTKCRTKKKHLKKANLAQNSSYVFETMQNRTVVMHILIVTCE